MIRRHCACGMETTLESCPVCGRYQDPGRAPNVPDNANHLNSHQRAAVLEWFARQPLVELRRRQSLLDQQITAATQRRLGSETLHSLDIKRALLHAAVDRKEFP